VQVAELGASLNIPAEHALHVRSVVAEPGNATCSPATQSLQLAHDGAFVVVLNVPGAQAAQVRSALAEPSIATYWPAAQSLHGAHAAALALLKELLGHAAHTTVLGPSLKVPAAHPPQLRSAVAEPGATTNSPGTQSLQFTHEEALVVVLKVPLEHAAQVRSAVAEPGVAIDWPGWQSLQALHAMAPPPLKLPPGQAAQVTALGVSLKVPARHGAQARSTIADPAVATYWPAAHSVHGVHEVAAVVALKAPLAHGVHVTALTVSLKVPGAHAAQVRSAAAEPAVATYSPAAHSLHGLQRMALALLKLPAAHGVQDVALALSL